MTAKLATLGYQLEQLYKTTDDLFRAVKDQPVRLIKDGLAYRSNGEGGYDHLPVSKGSTITVASLYNQGFNGVKVFAHFDGWTLSMDINDVASYID